MGNGGRSGGWVWTEKQLPSPPPPARGNDVTPERAPGASCCLVRSVGPSRPRVSLASGPEEEERAEGMGAQTGPIREDPQLESTSRVPVCRWEGVGFLSSLSGLQALPWVGDQITPFGWRKIELNAASVFSAANSSLPSRRQCGDRRKATQCPYAPRTQPPPTVRLPLRPS